MKSSWSQIGPIESWIDCDGIGNTRLKEEPNSWDFHVGWRDKKLDMLFFFSGGLYLFPINNIILYFANSSTDSKNVRIITLVSRDTAFMSIYQIG